MRDNYKEPKLTYALDSSGKMVHIGSVERGLSCNCRCPKCNEFLVAKLGHEGGRQAHFAHKKDSDCHGSYMSALHKLAEQIIEEEKAVMVPTYKEIEKKKLEFEKVEVEQRVERKDLQPDIVGVTSDGLRWFIEIRNTHEVDEAKRAKLIESNITCLEIDVREQTLENLKSFLLESIESREWINNPIYDKIVEDSYRKKVLEIVKQFKENPKIQIPQGDDISLQILCVSISEDGLYARIKALSSNGIPYLFHIGSHEVIKQIKPIRESNEILIDTDKNHFVNGYVPELNMTRLYLYVPGEAKKVYYEEQGFEVSTSQWSLDNQHFSSHDEYHHLGEPQIESKHDESVIQSQNNSLVDNLPFDRFWTIEEYYTQLQSTVSYQTEKGLLAEIVKCERTNCGILILYRDSIEVRTFTPFHIAIINVSNGDLIRNIVADFTNRKVALDSYCRRLKAMKEHSVLIQSIGTDENELPF